MSDALHIYHGDEDYKEGNDLYKERALEDVVETIMLYGEYPQPRRASYGLSFVQRIRQFDLREWLTENYKPEEIADFMVRAMTDYGLDFDEERLLQTDSIEKQLTVELRDSPIVLDKADELAREAEEDAE